MNDIDLAVSGSATVTFYGGTHPLSRSTVAVTGYDVTLNFLDETPRKNSVPFLHSQES